jgi:predicted anti-sigma-YlaC factor YlaD
MKQCDVFQQMIDRPADRNAQQRAELSAHLAGCRPCREYAAAAEQAMAVLAPLQARLSLPPERAIGLVRQHHRRKRRQAALALAAAALALPALLWFVYMDAPIAAAVVAAWLCLLGWRAWRSARKARSFDLRPGANTDDLLAGWRRELAWRVRTIVVLGPYMALETVVIAALFLAEGSIGPGIVAVGMLAIGVLGFIGHQWLVRLPALRREQALIADAGR